MATVPRERSGMASATMNALRQSGMTIGIALLGALMSARAVDALNGALARQGLPDALALARAAVLRHELPLAAGDARALLADALAGGFSLAMAVAGAASLAAAAMLALAARGEAGAARGLKPRRRASAKNPACRHGRRLIAHRDFKARNLRPLFLSIGNNALRRVAAPVSSAANNTLTGTR